MNINHKTKGRLRKNHEIADSIGRANFHYDRLGIFSDCTNAQKKYSQAFVIGDNKAAAKCLPEKISEGSQKFSTKYERIAYWRGVQNGNLRQ